MVALIELETERLVLRQWQTSDHEPFAALNADPRVMMEYFSKTLDRSESDAMAKRCEALIEERGWGFWAVEAKEDKRFIGFIGLHTPNSSLPFSPCVEIGWRLALPYWGFGYATEGAKAALQVGFERLGLTEIVSFTAVGNHRSRAVMEKLGMKEEPQTFVHPDVPVGNVLQEHCLYKLSRNIWHENSV
ncbi:MAG: GNAT family N-acetyltransferase [Candidatus Competibacteraceae bacterium]|nr:GNAT family N-acetyltransferase [Candidatus Competibacteraceae bacterium]